MFKTLRQFYPTMSFSIYYPHKWKNDNNNNANKQTLKVLGVARAD